MIAIVRDCSYSLALQKTDAEKIIFLFSLLYTFILFKSAKVIHSAIIVMFIRKQFMDFQEIEEI